MNKKIENNHLFSEIRQLIEQSRQQIATSVNSTMSTLYWQIGKRINTEILKFERAAYGKEVVDSLAKN